MPIAKRFSLFVLAALALGQAGCVLLAAGAVGGGAAAVGIARGTVARTFDASIEATTTATQSALNDLGLPLKRPRLGAALAEIDSALPGGEPLLLTLKAEPRILPNDPPQTRVEVHARIFGDKTVSDRLLDQISHRLLNPAPPGEIPAGTLTPLPPPTDPQTDEPALAPARSDPPRG